MTGKKPGYSQFPEYILGITHDIWEGRGINLLYDYYTEDLLVRSPDGVVRGNEAVIAATTRTQCEFPDRQLLGEDVIWDQTGPDSWYSSHRIMSLASYTGSGTYGVTGGKIRYRVIADCHAERSDRFGWRINDEWLVRDQGAILRQLGMDPSQWAPAESTNPLGARSRKWYRPDIKTQVGPYQGKGNECSIGRHYAELLTEIMGGGFAAIAREYDRACQLEVPEGKTCHGHDQAARFWISLRTSFPDARFTIEHVLGLEEAGLPSRAALRWSLEGKASGAGMFRSSSDSEVYIMGLSHAEFGPRGLRREFVLFDTLVVWQQLRA